MGPNCVRSFRKRAPVQAALSFHRCNTPEDPTQRGPSLIPPWKEMRRRTCTSLSGRSVSPAPAAAATAAPACSHFGRGAFWSSPQAAR